MLGVKIGRIYIFLCHTKGYSQNYYLNNLEIICGVKLNKTIIIVNFWYHINNFNHYFNYLIK